MNKKGSFIVVLMFFVMIFIALFIGLMLVFGSVVMNWTFDEIVPELTSLGMVGETNLSQASEYTVTPLNSVVQSFTWASGVIYVMMLVGLVGVTVAFRMNPSRWLIGFYFVLTIALIISSIYISNIYEEFYTGTDEVATRFHEHTMMSYLILYSPAIFTVICFVMGIILFSGMKEEFI